MSRLSEELAKRAQAPRTYTEAEQAIRDKLEKKKSSLVTLSKNKEFQVYLQIQEEMNSPDIVIAHKCSDPVCESLKMKIRDHRKLQKLMATVQNGVQDERTHQQSRRASR